MVLPLLAHGWEKNGSYPRPNQCRKRIRFWQQRKNGGIRIMTNNDTHMAGVEILGARNEQSDEILTPEALRFLVDLERRFGPRRRALLAARAERQKRLDAGERPDFLPETLVLCPSDNEIVFRPSIRHDG
jgi:hypothetical protein